jgi:hypothetical protein
MQKYRQTIKVATERLLNINLGTQPVVFLTDASSALQALQSSPENCWVYKYNCLNCVTSEKSLYNAYHLIVEYQETRKQADWLRKELEKSSKIHMSHTVRRKR